MLVGLAGCTAPATGPNVAEPPPTTVRVLQLNLCNSGIAPC